MTKKRFFPVLLLTLVLALSLTPISAFADGVNYMQKVKGSVYAYRLQGRGYAAENGICNRGQLYRCL